MKQRPPPQAKGEILPPHRKDSPFPSTEMKNQEGVFFLNSSNGKDDVTLEGNSHWEEEEAETPTTKEDECNVESAREGFAMGDSPHGRSCLP